MALAQWMRHKLDENLGLEDLEGSPAFRRAVATYLNQRVSIPPVFAGDFILVKYLHPMRQEYKYAVCTATFDGVQCDFARLFWPPKGKSVEYINLGGTYSSQDGEFRSYTLWREDFDRVFAFASETYAAWAKFELRILTEIQEGRLQLDVKTPDPDDLEFLEDRQPLRLLMAVAFADDDLSAHRLPASAAFHRKLHDFMMVDFPGPGGSKGFEVLRQSFRSGLKVRQCCIGQKLTPLSVREAANIGSLDYPAWREEFVARRATDCVINGISTGFPIYNQWAFVRDYEALFEGERMKAVLRDGTTARAALQLLAAARNSGEGARFRGFKKALFASAVRAEEELVLSKYVMLASVQHVGVGFGSFPEIAAGNANWRDLQQLKVLLFELCYNCMALHPFAVHTDVHANNFTVHVLQRMPADLVRAFVAGPRGEADTFLVPALNRRAYLIDFSQAFLNPALPDESREPLQFTTYFREQPDTFLALFGAYSPEFAKANQAAIKATALARPRDLYAALTLVDFIGAGRSFAATIRRGAAADVPDAEALESAAAAGDRLAGLAELELAAALDKIVLQGEPAGELANDAALKLLRGVFPEWVAPTRGYDSTICEFVSLGAALKFSGDQHEDFPDWSSPSALAAADGKRPVSEIMPRDWRELETHMRARYGLSADLPLFPAEPGESADDGWLD